MKRLLALFLSLVLMLGAVVPAYATGDGNFDGGGGGMGSGTSTNYWNPGMDGVRISVVNVDSHAVVGNTVDWSNQNPSTNMIHFGKVSKLSYIIFLLDDRIKTDDENLERYLGLSVLGNIPNADGKKSGKYGYYKTYAAYRTSAKQEVEDK